MALHKPKQLYVLGKLRFSSIKPMKMIEIWLKITFIFINGRDFQSGIKSVCNECKNNVFFSLPRKIVIFFCRVCIFQRHPNRVKAQVLVDRTLCCSFFFFNIDFLSYKQHFATFYVSLYDIYTINTIKQ
jgi:hypothetical protein